MAGTPPINVSLVSLNFNASVDTSSLEILDNNLRELGPEMAIPCKSSDRFL